jgi:hypothetical protein
MDTGICGTESRGNSICPIVSAILVPYCLVQYPSKMPRIFLRKLQKLPRKLQNEGGLEENGGVPATWLPLTGRCGATCRVEAQRGVLRPSHLRVTIAPERYAPARSALLCVRGWGVGIPPVSFDRLKADGSG